jgi:hypothetical protein
MISSGPSPRDCASDAPDSADARRARKAFLDRPDGPRRAVADHEHDRPDPRRTVQTFFPLGTARHQAPEAIRPHLSPGDQDRVAPLARPQMLGDLPSTNNRRWLLGEIAFLEARIRVTAVQ